MHTHTASAPAADQPYVDMLRALILKIYLITVAIVNKIVVMLVPAALVRKLTGRINKNRQAPSASAACMHYKAWARSWTAPQTAKLTRSRVCALLQQQAVGHRQQGSR